MRSLLLSISILIGFSNATFAASRSPAEQVSDIALASGCSRLGEAPKEFIEGMALVFAKAACHPDRPEVQTASSPPKAPITRSNSLDSASVLDQEFRLKGIPNKNNKETMLRHTYTILTGLAFRESSGRYCVGRYTSQGFSRSYEAEAGPFQTSWGARKAGESLTELFGLYRHDESSCMLNVFRDHVRCSRTDAINWNSENASDLNGVEWQALTKRCPAFATEYASVVVRNLGGAHGEFGPIKCYAGTQPKKIQMKCQKIEIYPVCDAMFSSIQDLLAKKPDICKAL